MDLESLRLVLKGTNMEAELAPHSGDVINVFCNKDGEHIGTVIAIELDENSGRKIIIPQALRWLEQVVREHLQTVGDHAKEKEQELSGFVLMEESATHVARPQY